MRPVPTVVLALALTLPAAPPAVPAEAVPTQPRAADERPLPVPEPALARHAPGVDAAALQEEWGAVKRRYRDRFGEALRRIDERIEALQAELDHGDRHRRERIAEALNDARRDRDSIEREHAELKAATAVHWANVKNRFDAAVEDLKD